MTGNQKHYLDRFLSDLLSDYIKGTELLVRVQVKTLFSFALYKTSRGLLPGRSIHYPCLEWYTKGTPEGR